MPLLVANLVGQIVFGLLAMTMCLPSMQEWAEIFSTSQANVQLTFSFYLVALGLGQLVYGPLSDYFGRRRVLIVGLVIAGLASFAGIFATSIAQIIAVRIVQALGACAGIVVGRAMVQDQFTGRQRTRVMAYIGAALGLSPPLGTILGGYLHVTFGWQSIFVFLAVLAPLLILAARLGLPQRRSRPAFSASVVRELLAGYGRLFRDSTFLHYATFVGAVFAAFYVFLAGAPVVLASYGVGPDGIGYYIMVIPLSYVVGNLAVSRLVGRFGEGHLMAVGQCSTLLGMGSVIVLALLAVDDPWAFTGPLVLFGFGHGLLIPPALVGTIGVIPALAGTAAAIAGAAQQILGAFGGYVVGLLDHDGPVALITLMLALTIVAVAIQYHLHLLSRRR